MNDSSDSHQAYSVTRPSSEGGGGASRCQPFASSCGETAEPSSCRLASRPRGAQGIVSQVEVNAQDVAAGTLPGSHRVRRTAVRSRPNGTVVTAISERHDRPCIAHVPPGAGRHGVRRARMTMSRPVHAAHRSAGTNDANRPNHRPSGPIGNRRRRTQVTPAGADRQPETFSSDQRVRMSSQTEPPMRRSRSTEDGVSATNATAALLGVTRQARQQSTCRPSPIIRNRPSRLPRRTS